MGDRVLEAPGATGGAQERQPHHSAMAAHVTAGAMDREAREEGDVLAAIFALEPQKLVEMMKALLGPGGAEAAAHGCGGSHATWKGSSIRSALNSSRSRSRLWRRALEGAPPIPEESRLADGYATEPFVELLPGSGGFPAAAAPPAAHRVLMPLAAVGASAKDGGQQPVSRVMQPSELGLRAYGMASQRSSCPRFSTLGSAHQSFGDPSSKPTADESFLKLSMCEHPSAKLRSSRSHKSSMPGSLPRVATLGTAATTSSQCGSGATWLKPEGTTTSFVRPFVTYNASSIAAGGSNAGIYMIPCAGGSMASEAAYSGNYAVHPAVAANASVRRALGAAGSRSVNLASAITEEASTDLHAVRASVRHRSSTSIDEYGNALEARGTSGCVSRTLSGRPKPRRVASTITGVYGRHTFVNMADSVMRAGSGGLGSPAPMGIELRPSSRALSFAASLATAPKGLAATSDPVFGGASATPRRGTARGLHTTMSSEAMDDRSFRTGAESGYASFLLPPAWEEHRVRHDGGNDAVEGVEYDAMETPFSTAMATAQQNQNALMGTTPPSRTWRPRTSRPGVHRMSGNGTQHIPSPLRSSARVLGGLGSESMRACSESSKARLRVLVDGPIIDSCPVPMTCSEAAEVLESVAAQQLSPWPRAKPGTPPALAALLAADRGAVPSAAPPHPCAVASPSPPSRDGWDDVPAATHTAGPAPPSVAASVRGASQGTVSVEVPTLANAVGVSSSVLLTTAEGAANVLQPPRQEATPSEGAGAVEAPAEAWFEVWATLLVDPVTRQEAIALAQLDVSARVNAERHLMAVMETEHRLLEQLFPRHILQHIMEDWTGAQSCLAHAETGPADDQDGGGLSDAMRAWRPVVRNFSALATAHPQVTLLFADIKGFTPMCEAVPPRSVMEMLNDLFSRFDKNLDRFGVYKVETIGDCYFVAGGLMGEDEDGMPAVRTSTGDNREQHARSVFLFAKAMMSAASCVLMPATGLPVQIRVGMHSGPVVSGVVGTRMPRFSLFGDTVNTASRMESTGSPGAIHVSAATRELLPAEGGDGGQWSRTGGIQVKGKGFMETYLWRPATAADVVAGAAMNMQV